MLMAENAVELSKLYNYTHPTASPSLAQTASQALEVFQTAPMESRIAP
jgi:hypothetical protein